MFFALACGSPPEPRGVPAAAEAEPATPAPDPCAPVDGKPAAPLSEHYTGLLAPARCQPEVRTIMQRVAKSLGVGCDYCHDETDYAADTPNKRVANWMATELSPRLAKRGPGAVTCADCHAADGHGKAKILGNPRSRSRAIEWMTTVLVERFDAAAGGPLFCKTCHGGPVGSPTFQGHVILTDRLPPRPRAAATPAASGSNGPE